MQWTQLFLSYWLSIMSQKNVAELVDKALSTFDTPEIAPIAHLSGGLNIFELFHGRTWAFKDLALSILGQLFNYFLSKRQKHLMIVVGQCSVCVSLPVCLSVFLSVCLSVSLSVCLSFFLSVSVSGYRKSA